MGIMADARINTSQRMVLYRDFIIQEAHDTKSGRDVWEWTHEDYDRVSFPVTGDCQTMFEAIDAVEAWYEEQEFAPEEISQFEALGLGVGGRGVVE